MHAVRLLRTTLKTSKKDHAALLAEAVLQGLSVNARTVVDTWESPVVHDMLAGVELPFIDPRAREVLINFGLETNKFFKGYNPDSKDGAFDILKLLQPERSVAGDSDAIQRYLTGTYSHQTADSDARKVVMKTLFGTTRNEEQTSLSSVAEGFNSISPGSARHVLFSVYYHGRSIHEAFLRKLHANAPRWRASLDPSSNIPLHSQRDDFVDRTFRMAASEYLLQQARNGGELPADNNSASAYAEGLYKRLQSYSLDSHIGCVLGLETEMNAAATEIVDTLRGDNDDFVHDVDNIHIAMNQLAQEDAMATFLKQQGKGSNFSSVNMHLAFLAATRGINVTSTEPMLETEMILDDSRMSKFMQNNTTTPRSFLSENLCASESLSTSSLLEKDLHFCQHVLQVCCCCALDLSKMCQGNITQLIKVSSSD